MTARAYSRQLAGSALAAALRDSRAITLDRVADLDDAAWAVPLGRGLNPIAWELGHLAWFAEFWVLRGPHILGPAGFVDAARPARIAGPDALYDSARLAHADRWRHTWPTREGLYETMQAQLEACIEAIPETAESPVADADAALYFHRLALFHEDMHAEAFTWLRAALGLAAPASLQLEAMGARRALRVAAADATDGRDPSAPGFSFDNEMPARTDSLGAFEIDSAPIDNAAFLAFVAAGGYDEPRFWPGAAAAWRAAHGCSHPARWRRQRGGWQSRWFDRWQPLAADLPVVHLSAWEAEAWCLWAGRRLPSATEWAHAAQSAAGFTWGGSVWEWTGSPFEPYPGFVPGPYRDYSLPWFGDHRELRGGSFASHARLHHPSYRNFFTPDRTDVFAGFRSCAVAS
ncbi:MAG: selenoneine synthase SenA [Caldimonas sp.]